MTKTLILKPRLSEQTYQLAQASPVYVFDVPRDANKHTIARAVTTQFEVTVETVNVTNVKGKPKRVIAKGGRRVSKGNRSDFKKAYVKLAAGQSLPFFAAVEEAEEKEQATQEKFDKAAAKQAEKEAKPARRGLRRKKDES